MKFSQAMEIHGHSTLQKAADHLEFSIGTIRLLKSGGTVTGTHNKRILDTYLKEAAEK